MTAIDFVPEYYRQKRLRRRGLLIQQVALGVGLLAMGGWTLGHRGRVADAEEALAAAQRTHRQVTEYVAAMGELNQRYQEMRVGRKMLAELSGQLSMAAVLADVAGRLPDGTGLTRIIIRPPPERSEDPRRAEIEKLQAMMPANMVMPVLSAIEQPTAQTALPTGSVLVLQGLAANDVQVGNFIASLARSPLVKDLRMEYSREVRRNNRPARQFELQCELVDRKVEL